MALEEHDREDLLREATALVERVELNYSAFPEPVVVGFRRDGAASFYFGADAVYQFNAQGELRRGFDHGQLIAAQAGRLYRLTRERTATATNLLRQELSDLETSAWLATARECLRSLGAALSNGSATVVGQQPPAADVLGRVRRWLAALPADLPVAKTPGVVRPNKKAP